jgi:hypothetical protein
MIARKTAPVIYGADEVMPDLERNTGKRIPSQLRALFLIWYSSINGFAHLRRVHDHVPVLPLMHHER